MIRITTFRLPAILIAFLVVVATHGAYAAEARIGDQLALKWATAAPDEFIQVIAHLRDRVEIQRDLPQLAFGHAPLAVRHTMTVRALQDRADATQHDLRMFLAAAERDGRAHSVHHFWIDNMVGLLATPALLADLARRPEIERIEFLPDATLIQPEQGTRAASAATHQPGLDVIGAPALWAMGLTGKGRLACGVDTGVRGTHRALSNRWRGNHVPVDYAWLDPRGISTLPTDIGTQSPSHGTHTMGTMLGADTVSGDTIGVAPGAEWIAAFGIGSAGLNTLDLIFCLQWAADPDGDPNTTADVPDVLNCSWGFSSVGIIYPCNDIFDEAISNLEAAGVIVIWAAGNEGSNLVSGQSTIRYPANTSNAFGTNFSVGNYNPGNDSIWGSSSRGPTPCAGDSIKPEIVAPGVNITSAVRASDSAYSLLTGTSMAAPHVSGAALLLRQLAPNATPQQIKRALYVSAIDKGPAGEDNNYGNGLLNIPAAADSLLASLSGDSIDLRIDIIAVTDNNNNTLHAGDTVTLMLGVENRGGISATNACLKITTADIDVVLIPNADSAFIGLVPAYDTSNVAGPLKFRIMPGTPDGRRLDLTLEITADGFTTSQTLTYYTAPEPLESFYTHDNTVVQFTVTNFGLFGLNESSYYPMGGAGFIQDPSPTNHLAAAALAIATGIDKVSDAARRSGGGGKGYQIHDHDFRVVEGGALTNVPPIDIEIDNSHSVFDDSRAENPIGVKITQHSLIYDRGVNESFVILIYTLENTSGGPIAGLRAGIFEDWDFPNFLAGQDTTDFDAANNVAFMWDQSAPTGSYRGVAVLSSGGASAYRSVNPQGTWYTNDPIAEIILTDSMKWDYLSGGIGPGSVGTGSYGDAACVIGLGPIDLPSPGDTAQIAFAFVSSESGRDTLLLNAQAAQTRYDIITNGNAVTDPLTPRDFRLHQNYPNPFNPATKIALTLSDPAHARIDVFNVLGRQVATLVDQLLPAGEHAFTWDSRDRHGNELASGVYFYRLKLGEHTETRKMLLLR